VYSLGSNNVFDFEAAVLEFRSDCEIHTFDPTSSPPQGDFASKVHFHNFGLAKHDGVVSIGGVCGGNCQVKSLPNVIAELKHQESIIDIFKIDIEGAEFDAFIDLLYSCAFPTNIRMILIELHYFGDRFDPNRHSWNNQRLFLGLEHAGYTQYYKEFNAQYSGGNCIEFAFIRTKL
jgi:hypothetical protein